MKILFNFLLKKYSKTEVDRIVIYKELWESITNEYNQQTYPGNILNMQIEFMLSNPIVIKSVKNKDYIYLQIIKNVVIKGVDQGIEILIKTN
jgi:hypothetical protein